MSALDQNPVVQNQLLPNRFRLLLKRAPNFQFWCQETMIPGLSIPPTKHPTPFVSIPLPGDHIDFESFGTSFMVDEDFANYLEIFNWMKAIGTPDRFEQYAPLANAPKSSGKGVKSDVSLIILNGQNKANIEVVYHDAFPVAMSELSFSSKSSDLDRLFCHVEFKYTSFEIQKLNVN